MQGKIDRALKSLGIKNFLLGIHDAAFPSLSEEDFGRGTPYSEGAVKFLGFVRSLGFNGIQLGPQGITTEANSSPYDGSLFSRNPLSLAMLPLTRMECRLLKPESLARISNQLSADCTRVDDVFARAAIGSVVAEVCSSYRRAVSQETLAVSAALFDSFVEYRRANGSWLSRDALYQSLRQHYGGRNWRQWSGGKHARLDKHLFAPQAGGGESALKRIEHLHRQYSGAIEDYCFIQFLLAQQHRELRSTCGRLGLKLFGDCQIGLSGRDAWAAQSFLLPDYFMGAPPSRTNSEGQPWNYPVFNPHLYFVTKNGNNGDNGQAGPVVQFFQQRMEKLTEEFDGLRLDHPHGLICPWVYKAGKDDPFVAVQNGARLFSSPQLTEHPALIKYALVRPDQLNTKIPRYEEGWVADLDDEQVHRYGRLFDVVMQTARKKWSGLDTIACEVLSTQPYPMKRIMQLYGMGRFRVTQKVDLDNKFDVYRSENAQPEDWLMLGNHDTPSIRQVAERWFEERASERHAKYLSRRLRIPEEKRTDWIERLSIDTDALVQAKFAELFVGPAQNVMVFFTDLLGNIETYNQPGLVSKENWTLRVPRDYQKSYKLNLMDNLALNIPKALAAALRAKGATTIADNQQLIRELEEES